MADACASTFECLDATGAGESEDQAALVAMLEQMFAGWTAGSGERIAGVFAEDGDFVSIDAVHARGRTAIAREHQRLLTSLYQGSSIAARVTSVRFVRPDVACVHAEAQVGSYGEPAPDPASAGFCPTFRLTVMATRRATGEWQFEALQQTRLAPASTGKPRFADRRYGGRRT